MDLDWVPSEDVARRLALIDEWSKEPAVGVARVLLAEHLPAGTEIEVLPAFEVQRLRALEAENLKLRQEVDALRELLRAGHSRSATDGV